MSPPLLLSLLLPPQSEYDSVVVECAGSVMGPLAAVVGGDAMLGSLPALLSPLIDRLVGYPVLKLFLTHVTFLSPSSSARNLPQLWPTDHLRLAL